ncbi:MAG: Holliday junction resolvase RuvX [Bacteroidaceae bacterium]|nr:Holliday junction resolvase RuvX [Bacteroidaceae bacterium]MBR4842674.1 Holliday junction resolvase RuvX [Bacteroidaceae bacterium]
MGRILSIDYGTKRTGIAVTDPLRIIPGGLTTVPTHTLLDFLTGYFGKEEVDVIVVGYALNMDGRESASMKQIRPFTERLKKLFPDKRIEMYDERFTSVIAQKAILEAGVKKMARRNKALVDEVSACIILESYLESNRNSL